MSPVLVSILRRRLRAAISADQRLLGGIPLRFAAADRAGELAARGEERLLRDVRIGHTRTMRPEPHAGDAFVAGPILTTAKRHFSS